MALTDKEWNDERVRTVFAAPNAHLVIMTHDEMFMPQEDTEEGYELGAPAKVNSMYRLFAETLITANEMGGFSLFKTISVLTVINAPEKGYYGLRMTEFSSPLFPAGLPSVGQRLVTDSHSLLEFLQNQDRQLIASGS